MGRRWGKRHQQTPIIPPPTIHVQDSGKTVTKAQSIADLKSGASATQSIDLGEIKVRVFANTGIVTGNDTEKSTYKGKDSSGKCIWTDVFVNRNGRWQAVASQLIKLDK